VLAITAAASTVLLWKQMGAVCWLTLGFLHISLLVCPAHACCAAHVRVLTVLHLHDVSRMIVYSPSYT
jgi:hypothetical protein